MKRVIDLSKLELLPLPHKEWQAEYNRLMRGAYLKRKYSRHGRLVEKRDYIVQLCPELLTAMHAGLLVIDVGTGPGEFLEIARQLGWSVGGIEAPGGEGGMGDEYWRLSRLLHERQVLAVEYCGWRHHVALFGDDAPAGDVFLFNFQGSWEQCYHVHLEGEPHHVHHKASAQRWRFTDWLLAEWHVACRYMARRLVKGGLVLNWGNGTDGAGNEAQYAREIRRTAEEAGLELVKHEGTRLHKWRKP